MAGFITPLPNRGSVTISGEDRASFVQGLISNDIHGLTDDTLLYACMLTPQGKFLHDFFIRSHQDTLILDCEGGDRAQDLHDRLLRFRLRAKIDLSVQASTSVFVAFGDDTTGYADPRHSDMGHRIYQETAPSGLEERPFDHPDGWDARRIALTIPDGSRDMIVEKSTLDEAHLDQLNAVSYDKGCYVGQELTARMHYRGLGKKHLQTLKVSDHPDADFRSKCGDFGIALVRTPKS